MSPERDPRLEVVGPGEPTESDRYPRIIQGSFTALEPRMDEVVSRLYATLFGISPVLRALFPLMLQTHRNRFTRAFAFVVKSLDRPEYLASFLAQLGRDHRKFDVLEEHYGVFGRALLTALRDVAGDAWTPEVAQAWERTYAAVAEAMMTGARKETAPASWSGVVVGHSRVSSDVAVVHLRIDPFVPYRAGQYLNIETPQYPRLWRSFSPANVYSADGVVELHVKAIEFGNVSRSIVWSTRIGDTWRVGPPMGSLCNGLSAGRDVLMIGGGTGIAPLFAMVRELDSTRQAPGRVVVYYGARRWDDLYALDDLRRMSYRNTWLDVVPVVEERPPVPGTEVGRLVDVVTRYGAWSDSEVVVSGSPAMVQATVRQMAVNGTDLDHVHFDPFMVD